MVGVSRKRKKIEHRVSVIEKRREKVTTQRRACENRHSMKGGGGEHYLLGEKGLVLSRLKKET